MNRQCTAKRVAAKIIASSVFAFVIIGCATTPSNTAPYSATSNGTASAPPPDVNDCARITSSSPTRYQCGDKTYTAYDLTKLQHDTAQQNAGR